MRIKSALVLAGFFFWGLVGSASAGVDAAASAKCLKCHEGHLEMMNRTPHAVAADPRTPTCVTCHGPSDKHAENPTEVEPTREFHAGESAAMASEASEVCLGCHQKDSKRALWATSAHPAADVACNNCHKIHASQDKVLSKRSQPDVCFTCHKEQRAQGSRPYRHPLAEGKMACSDCHNPHGSAGPKLVKRDSTNDTCYTCHAEKRGPFVQSHQPVTEDCASCHSPHGSSVAGMLKARAPILCQQCHTPHVAGSVGALGGQPGVSNATSSGLNVVNIWQGRSCLNCHTQIHGSNNPKPQLMFR